MSTLCCNIVTTIGIKGFECFFLSVKLTGARMKSAKWARDLTNTDG
jgi:hypothetical protein